MSVMCEQVQAICKRYERIAPVTQAAGNLIADLYAGIVDNEGVACVPLPDGRLIVVDVNYLDGQRVVELRHVHAVYHRAYYRTQADAIIGAVLLASRFDPWPVALGSVV